jgi:Na+/proline symporter
MLLLFIVMYMSGTLLFGYWASRKVKNTRDYVLAGHRAG